MNNSFRKSSNGSIKLTLDDELFQQYQLYNQDYEDAVSKIESHYNSWLKDIENLYDYIKEYEISDIEKLKENNTLRELYFCFFDSCKRMIYFAFLQWIRYPNENSRIFLFDIFKQVMLRDDTHYIQLSARDFIKIGEDKLLALKVRGDKDIYKYAFEYIDQDKFSNIADSSYRVLVDYSEKGEFITSTSPVAPLFSNDDKLPYGFLFPLSPHIMFRLVKREGFEHYGDGKVFSLPCTAKNEDISRFNQTLLLYCPGSLIVAGDETKAKNVFSGMRIAIISEIQDVVNRKIERIQREIKETLYEL